MVIGREKEIILLNEKYVSLKSEFVALYGRRRVGKTFLVRNTFENKLTFKLTGLANVTLKQQLLNFSVALHDQHPDKKRKTVDSWMVAFQQIRQVVEKSKHKKKVIFVDELPWFDTPKAKFLQALEHFWNGWAYARKDVLLIVCGSAASWMINKLTNNKGDYITGLLKK